MSNTLMFLHEAMQHASHLVADTKSTPSPTNKYGIPNPAPKAPAGASAAASTIMAIIKWGSLSVIIAGGFVGSGALVGGKIFGHHKSASMGQSILLVAVCAAVVWGMIFAFLMGLV